MVVDGTPPVVATRDDRDPSDRAALPVDLVDLGALLADVLAAEGASGDAEASLQLVSPERMSELNVQHLGGTGPTDVLSFPLDGIGDADHDDRSDPLGIIVGDVVICPEVAASQASEHAGDLPSELALLVVHGGLHLCGWDHADADERAAMWARERHLLESVGRAPLCDPWGSP
ncbi:MAG: rRNA maturation RNase YbeY [Actinobacteria bacterium]|nr:rRNA maturation RNase YbeY [Actinomycetota bacterium]